MENINLNEQMPDINGTSPGEVLSMTFCVPISSLLVWLISSVLSVAYREFQSCFEVISLHLILLLALTSLSGHLPLLFMILGIFLFVVLFATLSRHSLKEINCVLKSIKANNVPEKEFNKSFIGDYRGHLLIATSICILAVDFQIFPSRFAKTDTFGWSIMDAGVGSFVLLHGLTHARSTLSNQPNSMKKGFLSSLPLFILGVCRLALITAIGYHKVVPEYGIHWNFFFTLSLTKVICYSVLNKFKVNPGLLAVIAVIFHQFLLSKAGLSTLVMSDVRRNIFEANKEGICSLPGFITLYFSGVQIGYVVWRKRQYKVSDFVLLLVKLCWIGLGGWILMYLFHTTIDPVSRRMANLAYCTWIVSLTSLQIAVHLCHRLIVLILNELFKTKLQDILLFQVVNNNGLFYFLMANLLTGLVNLTLNTDETTHLNSLLILIIYLSLLFISSLILYQRKRPLH